jgi:hypothetical protein
MRSSSSTSAEAPGQADLLRHAMRAFIHDGEEVARKNEGTETVVEKKDRVITWHEDRLAHRGHA